MNEIETWKLLLRILFPTKYQEALVNPQKTFEIGCNTALREIALEDPNWDVWFYISDLITQGTKEFLYDTIPDLHTIDLLYRI